MREVKVVAAHSSWDEVIAADTEPLERVAWLIRVNGKHSDCLLESMEYYQLADKGVPEELNKVLSYVSAEHKDGVRVDISPVNLQIVGEVEHV
jgi:hypothetical protein